MNNSLCPRFLAGCIAIAIVALVVQDAHSAVKERAYTMGDNDTGAAIGGLPPVVSGTKRGTADIQPSTTDYGSVDPPNNVNQSLVSLVGFSPIFTARYADASDRPGAVAGNLALNFDGAANNMYCLSASGPAYSFDPRDFGGGFNTLSQAWVKPTALTGLDEFVYRVGAENGGVKINPDGHWALRTGNPAGTTPLSDVEVETGTVAALNQWTHVAVFRGGNFSILYINGSIAALDPGFWGGDGPDVTVGANNGGNDSFYKGLIDNFNIGTTSDGVFNVANDVDYYHDKGLTFSGVTGDINQDGVVNVADYNIWKQHVGLNNTFGRGDPGTLLLGDADQSGRIDLVDFLIINKAAGPAAAAAFGGGVPEPTSIALLAIGLSLIALRRARFPRSLSAHQSLATLAVLIVALATCATSRAAVVVADDFLYDGASKTLHVGGGFNGNSQYLGGQNGSAGSWTGNWAQNGDGVITTPAFVPPIDPFNGLLEPIPPFNVALYDGFFGVESELYRNFALNGVAPTQTLYFGGKFKADLDIGTDNHTVTQFYAPRLFLNRVFGDDRYFDINGIPLATQRDRTRDIGLGFESYKDKNTMQVTNLVVARLGSGLEAKTAVIGAQPNDGNWHQIVGKLEMNVSGGANEQLTVWIDPTGVETGGTMVQTQADVLTDLTGLIGTFHSQGTRPTNPNNTPGAPAGDPVDSLISDPNELGRSYIDGMAIGTAWQDAAAVNVPRLTLRISRSNGAAKIVNSTSTALAMNGYSVESTAGSLNGVGWNSLNDQNVGNWQENLATTHQLGEADFQGSTTVAAGGQLALGNLFTASGTEDETGRFTTADGLQNLFKVEFVNSFGVAGDYNNNGIVDAADYTVWRDHLGSSFALPNRDSANSGNVSIADYNSWKTHFGQSAGSGALGASPVPEPGAFELLFVAMLIGTIAGCRPRQTA